MGHSIAAATSPRPAGPSERARRTEVTIPRMRTHALVARVRKISTVRGIRRFKRDDESSEGSHQPDFGDRNYEASSPSPVDGLLRQDLLREIPRQQQYVVWLLIQELLRRTDRQVGSRHVAPLLHRAAIHDEVERLRADVEII